MNTLGGLAFSTSFGFSFVQKRLIKTRDFPYFLSLLIGTGYCFLGYIFSRKRLFFLGKVFCLLGFNFNKMKRVSLVDQEARARLKHQNLLHEFLDLQKEFVSKKKKLQAMNQKRDTLLDEVRFLRQRYNYLSTIKSQEYEQQQDSAQSQNPHLQSKMAKPKSLLINEAGERTPSPLPDINLNVVNKEGSGRNQRDVDDPLIKEKKPKNRLVNGKRLGKKKISWQDPVALRV